MSNKKAYIAGPVSGLPFEQAEKAFNKKQRQLEAAGYKVVNPVTMMQGLNTERTSNKLHLLDDANAADRSCMMRQCIAALTGCDEIHLLPGWQFSEGAQIERKVAELLKIKIVEP